MSNSLNILVLDDDVDLADALAELLEMEGHDVTVVHNGMSAIEAFTQNDFDVGFFDVKMPGMNGVESFLEIKKIKPNAKIFMMTGYSVEQLLEQALENGALGIMRKPFDPNELFAKLDGINDGLVVVADADPAFTDRIVPALEEAGYKVCLVKTGEEALNAVDGTVNLLVLDLDLPILSGLEVYLELKKRGAGVPTIVVTAQCEEQFDGTDTLSKQPISGVFHKPFDIGEFLLTVQKVEAEAAYADQPALI
jgi:two-component system response regulator HydG